MHHDILDLYCIILDNRRTTHGGRRLPGAAVPAARGRAPAAAAGAPGYTMLC